MLRMGLTIVQLFAALAIIALVLLQRGKGADAGAGFWAGASGTVFGARGARTALSRATAIFAAVFMLNSLALAYMGTRQAAEAPKSILDEAAGTTVPAPSGTNIPAPSASSAPEAVPTPGAPAAEQSQAPAVEAPAPESTPAPGTTSPTPQQ